MPIFNTYPTIAAPAPADTLLVYHQATGTVRQAPAASTSVTALKALSVTGLASGSSIYLSGFSSFKDGGEGVFVYDPTSVLTANAGTILAPDSGSGRWIRAYSGPINVRWFGAKGDGLTNDRSAIQAAIDAAIGFSGSVFIPLGQYRIQSSLTINSNSYNKLRIFGVGFESQILHVSGAHAFTIDNSSGTQANLIQIEHLAIDASGNSSATGGIYFGAAGRAVIRECYIINYTKASGAENTRGYGIIIDSSAVGLISVISCHLGNGYAAVYSVANGVQFIDCVTEITTGPGFYINAGTGVSVRGCRFQAIGTIGIAVPVGGGITIEGGCYFEGCTTNSIYCGESSQVRGLVINGNSFTGTTGTHHIKLDFTNGVTIDGNFFNTSGSTGLVLVAGSETTVGVYFGCGNGFSSAVLAQLAAATRVQVTQTNPVRYGLIYDVNLYTWNPGSLTKWGNMYGTTLKNFAVQNNTNNGVQHVGGTSNTQLLDNQNITFTMSGAALIVVEDATVGYVGAFVAEAVSATIVKLADPSSKWEVTNTDSGGNLAIYKSASTGLVTIKNYMNITMNLKVQVLGLINAATAPAN